MKKNSKNNIEPTNDKALKEMISKEVKEQLKDSSLKNHIELIINEKTKASDEIVRIAIQERKSTNKAYYTMLGALLAISVSFLTLQRAYIRDMMSGSAIIAQQSQQLSSQQIVINENIGGVVESEPAKSQK